MFYRDFFMNNKYKYIFFFVLLFTTVSILTSCGERKNPVGTESPPLYEIVGAIPPIGVFRHLFIDNINQTGYLSADYMGVLTLNLSNSQSPSIMDTLKNNELTPGAIVSSCFSYESGIIYLESLGEGKGLHAFGLDSINTAVAGLLVAGSPPLKKFDVREFFSDPSGLMDSDSIHLYFADASETEKFYRLRYMYSEYLGYFLQMGGDNYYEHTVYDFVIQDSLAYLAIDEFGMTIVDLSNYYVLPVVGGFDSEGFCQGIDVQGNYCYMADRHWGLQVLDISDPTNPVRVANLKFDKADDCFKVKVLDDRAVVLDRYDGVFAVDISDPANPVEIFNFDTITPTAVVLTEDLIYVIDEDMGLVIAAW